MRQLCLVWTALCAVYAAGAPAWAAAPPDPASKHYSSGKMPHDPMLTQAKPLGHYRGFLRLSVDLSTQMPPVGDQGPLPASMAWAMAYAARAYYEANAGVQNLADPHNEASPSYVYHLAREGGCVDGVTPSEVTAVLRRGALSLAEYPYSAACAPPAPQALVAQAHAFRVQGVAVLDPMRLDDIKAQIEHGNPVVVSFRDDSVFQAFRGDGVFDEPTFDANTEEEAYQALTLIGYDERRQAVRVMNSWGEGWGDRGFAWISYAALTARVNFALVLNVAPDEMAPAPAGPSEAVAPSAPVSPAAPGAPTASPNPPEKAAVAPAPKADFAALENLSCGHVDRVYAEGRTVLSGHVATADDLALVTAVAATEPQTRLGKVDIVPWPLCETLDTLARPLAGQDTPRLTVTPSQKAVEGDTLRIAVEAPHKPSFLYISYVQADGTVVTLAQPQTPVPSQTAPGQKLSFGDGQNGRTRFTVSPPFGAEMVVVLAAGSPLFAAPLPAQESERDYLSRLRAALLYKPSPDLPDRDVTAAVHALTTRSRASETAGGSP